MWADPWDASGFKTLLIASVICFLIGLALLVRRWHRNRWRIAIEDLFFLILLAAVVAFAIGFANQKVREVAAARSAVTAIGGTFVELIAQYRYEVYLDNPAIDDEDLLRLKPFIKDLPMIHIYVGGSSITKQGAHEFQQGIRSYDIVIKFARE